MIVLSDIVRKIQLKNIKIGDVRKTPNSNVHYKIEDIVGNMMDVVIDGNRRMSWYTNHAKYDPLVRRNDGITKDC